MTESELQEKYKKKIQFLKDQYTDKIIEGLSKDESTYNLNVGKDLVKDYMNKT